MPPSLRANKPDSSLLAHGHARRLHTQHQRPRTRAGAARAHDGVRSRSAADAGAAGGGDVCRPRHRRQEDHADAARGLRVARLRRAVVRPFGVRHRSVPERADRPQDCPGAARSAAAQARQPALRRHVRPGEPAGPGGDPVQDEPRRRARRRRERQARGVDPQAGRGLRRDAEGRELHGGPGGRPPGSRRSAGRRRRGKLGGRGRAGRPLPAEDPDRRDFGRRLGHPLRAVRKVLPGPLPARRHPDGGRAAAARHQGQARVPDQGHLQARHLGKAGAAGRPDEDRAVEVEGDRLPGQHAADALRREDRDAYPRFVRASSSASRRWATSRISRRRCCRRSGVRTA